MIEEELNMMRLSVLVAVSTALISTTSSGQTMRPQLDYATAASMRDACLSWATKEKLAVAVAIYNRQGVLLTMAQSDGAPSGVGEIAQWKGRSAAIFEAKSSVTAEWGTAPGLAGMAGGVSFATGGGEMLGGIGVSGASPEQDEACGMAAIDAAGLKAQDTP
jgi:glc operon protein GlcG